MRSLAVSAVSAACCFTVISAPAQAEPAQPTTVAQAQAQVDKLTTEASIIDQDYDAAQAKYAASNKKLASERADLAQQRKKVDAMRGQVAQIALATFQQRNTGTTAAFFSSKQDDFFAKLSMMQQVTANQKVTLQKFQAEQANLNDMTIAAEADVAAKQQAQADMADARKRSQAKVDQAQKILDRLTAEQRAQIAAEQAAQQRRDQAAAEQAARAQAVTRTNRSNNRPAATSSTSHSTSSHSTSSRSSSSNQSSSNNPAPSAPAPAPASGRAATAVAFARAQLGKPYVYGATGPGSYDCSGLTGAAWAAAGVHLPRTSQAQYGAGSPVSRSQLQPGDLVFFYGLGHVGIYVGGGMVIHAPKPGQTVRYAPVSSMPYVGARRPG